MSTPLLLLLSIVLLNTPSFGRDIPEPGMGKEFDSFKERTGLQGNFKWACTEEDSQLNNTADFFDVRTSVECEINTQWKQAGLSHVKIMEDLFGAEPLTSDGTKANPTIYPVQLIRIRTLNPNSAFLNWGPKWSVLDRSQISFSGDIHNGRVVKTSQRLETEHPFLKNMVNLDMSFEFQQVPNGEKVIFEIFTRIDKKTHWTNRTVWKLWPSFSEMMTKKATLSHLNRFTAAGLRLLSTESSRRSVSTGTRSEGEVLP